MKIEFEGRTWGVDVDALGVKQAVAITDYTGGTLLAWEKALADVDSPGWLRAVQSLYWLMLAQNSETTDPGPGDADFAVLKYSRAAAEAMAAEEEAEKAGKAAEAEKPGPTSPAGAARPVPRPGPRGAPRG